MLGAIEAGGTKFVCAVGDEEGNVIDQVQFPTTIPFETMRLVINFFKNYHLDAIGIGSFGPVELNRNSAAYGNITTTPKSGWRDYPFLKTVQDAFGVPVGFNTDVNVAALGESILGAAKGLDSCLYITIGTGIGAGAVVNGKLLQGLSHPEMGHTLIRRHPDDHYEGKCPYHKDCFEGLAAGPALEARWGEKAINLADRAEVWDLEGYYIAQAIMQYMLILSPKRIVLGGGVMHQSQVFDAIYKHLPALLNGYIQMPALPEYIVSPGLGDGAGITGALLLGKQTMVKKN